MTHFICYFRAGIVILCLKMAIGTCLLCGKSLARIRVSVGGDFCSREHRSQYRLRRVMDCLAEANKVATLARRRETPKPLFGEAAPGTSGAVRRGFPEAAPFRITPSLNAGVRWRRKADRAVPLPRAGFLAEPIAGIAPRGVPREYEMKLAASGAAAVLRSPVAGWKPAAIAGTQARGPRAIAVFAAPGKAMRAPASTGFRLRAPDPHSFTYAAGPDRGGVANVAGRTGWSPNVAPRAYPGAPAKGRLAFVDMGFPAGPVAPARLGWLGVNGTGYPGRKGREL